MINSGFTMKQTKAILASIKVITNIDIRLAPTHDVQVGRYGWVKCQKCRKRTMNLERMSGEIAIITDCRKQICKCPMCGQLLLIG